jgi:hypothetical protein
MKGVPAFSRATRGVEAHLRLGQPSEPLHGRSRVRHRGRRARASAAETRDVPRASRSERGVSSREPRTTNESWFLMAISIFERATARGIARRTVSDRDREGRAFRELRSIAKIAVGPRFRPAGQRLEAPFKEKKERPATWISV